MIGQSITLLGRREDVIDVRHTALHLCKLQPVCKKVLCTLGRAIICTPRQRASSKDHRRLIEHSHWDQ